MTIPSSSIINKFDFIKVRMKTYTLFTVLFFSHFFFTVGHAAELNQLKASECVFLAKIPNATLQNCRGQNIVTLEGTSSEMALAHARIFRKHLTSDVAKYFSFKVDDAVSFLPAFLKNLAHYILAKISSKLHDNMPAHYSEDLATYSLASNLSHELMSKALAAPDLASLGYSYVNSPLLGCTSVGQIQNGDLVYGRNLDFDGTNVIDKHSLLVIHKPTVGNELKRAAFVADGIHFAGISAFNEAGLAVFVHQNFSSERSLQGLPIMLMIDWMLKESRNLDEAINFLKSHRPGPMWTLVLVDTKQKQIKTVESSFNVFGVREPKTFTRGKTQRTEFVQTNNLLTDEAIKTQWISYPLLRNSQMRYKKASEMLAKTSGDLSIETLRGILSHQETLSHSEPSLYDDVVKPSTVHTVFIEAKKGHEPVVWLSRSLAPSSQGHFVKFKMNDFFADTNRPLAYEFAPQSPRLENVYSRQRLLVQAFKASEDEANFKKALQLTKDFHAPAVLLFRASLFYRLNQWENVRSEINEFKKSKAAIPKGVRESAASLSILSLYQEGKIDEARQQAQELLKKTTFVQNHWQGIIKKIAADEDLSDIELEIRFDSFSGDIDTAPSHLTLLSDLAE